MNRQQRRQLARHRPAASTAEATSLQPVHPLFAAAVSAVYPSGAHRRRLFLTLPAAQREKERAAEAGAAVSVDLVELRPVSGAAQREAAMAALTVVPSGVAS